jgi:thiaminase
MNAKTDFRKVMMDRFEQQGRVTDAFVWNSREAYADWLAQTYYFVCHSTRLLALAAARFSIREDALHLRFLDHLREEKSHEKLATADLRALGRDIRDYSELPETKAFYQTQYYLIEHVNPRAFFGYILSLEGLAALRGPKLHEQLKALYGAPATAFIKVHGEDDIEHVEKAFHQLAQLPESDMQAVLENLDASCRLYGLMLDAIKARSAVASGPMRKAA